MSHAATEAANRRGGAEIPVSISCLITAQDQMRYTVSDVNMKRNDLVYTSHMTVASWEKMQHF